MADNVFGVIAEFRTPGALLEAARRVHEEGYRHFDCYTPFPVHGLEKAMGLKDSLVPWLVLGGGITGFVLGVLLQGYSNVVDLAWVVAHFGEDGLITSAFKGLFALITSGYPLIIGGKPYFSYQAFVPVIFEVTVLLSAFGAVFGMLALNRLPMYYHPVFKHPNFRRASDDRFFLCVEARDPWFSAGKLQGTLTSAGGEHVMVLEA